MRTWHVKSSLYVLASAALSASLALHAQEPLNETSNPTCPSIDGLYKNSGAQLSGHDRNSKIPPSLAFDVLNTGRPGSSPTYVEIETENKDKLIFKILGPERAVIHERPTQVRCENGWLIFSWSVSGGSEGYRGTDFRTVRLKRETAGKLIANVIIDSKGKDFYIIPHTAYADRTYEFSKHE